MNQQKKILVAPLDWGLGHAARCIPIIKSLLERNCEVQLGGSGISGKLLQMEFPDLPYDEIPGYEVTYSSKMPMAITMLRQAPGILRSIQQEKKWLERFVETNKIDAVISDHRYGLYNKNIYSIFMGHQLFISSGNNDLLEPLLWKVNKSYIENFNMCWIPDLPGEPNASGKLSHKAPVPFPHCFIGLLSRLDSSVISTSLRRQGPRRLHSGNAEIPIQSSKFKAAFILSGLEPLRTELENLIIDQSDSLPSGNYFLIRGTSENIQRTPPANFEIIDLADSKHSAEIISSSELIVSRAGYSSIMDYLVTGTKALLIPTPGQTEQEYLVKYHLENNNFYSVTQDKLDLIRDMKLALTYQPQIKNDESLLEEAIDKLSSVG